MDRVWIDECSELDEEMISKLKTAREIPPLPFGCATPILSFYDGKEVVKWLDHNGDEI